MYLVNLKRRPDRYASFMETCGFSADTIHVHYGFDGKNVTEWTPELQRLFHDNRFNSLVGIIGAAMSHYSLWKHIATTENQHHLIIEDDANCIPDFADVWNREYASKMPEGYDVIYLGGYLHFAKTPIMNDFKNINDKFQIRKMPPVIEGTMKLATSGRGFMYTIVGTCMLLF